MSGGELRHCVRDKHWRVVTPPVTVVADEVEHPMVVDERTLEAGPVPGPEPQHRGQRRRPGLRLHDPCGVGKCGVEQQGGLRARHGQGHTPTRSPSTVGPGPTLSTSRSTVTGSGAARCSTSDRSPRGAA